MRLSLYDMFKVGIGPSSSHTVGPMHAAKRFTAELYGSLGHTGKGHGTDVAVQLGLEGETPDATDVDLLPARLATIAQAGTLKLLGRKPVTFRLADQIVIHRRKDLLPKYEETARGGLAVNIAEC